ncbi:CidA/LrgA family protein [Endozoicomonas ascidiicola]|uniref:CidA/LrgA family protein n=1 Tax=Endozoicomonas ascidiicola TaxID=1698521 RepID=UPI0012F90422|nr:CidA/LrgA family protein [Endozoicomonas ascidiicola]
MPSGILPGIVTLLFFTVAGEIVNDLFDLPVPGSVIGLILLVVYLQVSANESEGLDKVSQFCIRYLAVLFIPGCVGIFFLSDLLLQQWLPITLAMLVATPVSLVLTALLMQWLLKRFEKASEGEHHG